MSIRNGMPASELPEVTWRKSRRSGPQGGNCVEIAQLPDGQVAIRNSRHPPARPWCLRLASGPPSSAGLGMATSTEGPPYEAWAYRGARPRGGWAYEGRWTRKDPPPSAPPLNGRDRSGVRPARRLAGTRKKRGSGDREVKFPVLRPDQEALPLMPVEDVRCLAAVL